MTCRSCGSENQEQFSTEIAIHLPDRNKPLVLIFPKLLVCVNCGKPAVAEEFTIPAEELRLLARCHVPTN